MNDVQEKSARSAARHEALRTALLDAAEAAIATAGLAGLRARDLAQAAGCAVGAVYNVFEDLDAIALGVNGRTLDALDRALARVKPVPDPVAHAVALAVAYLDYAARNRARWAALFEHRMPQGRAVPGWYVAAQARVFAHVEAPLGAFLPALGAAGRGRLARGVFSAVHGVVALGLDEKLAPMSQAALRAQVAALTRALLRGLKD